jgi:EAL domain-containing protein (putative c-di-GMP-specific phosphodiesterase class I)
VASPGASSFIARLHEAAESEHWEMRYQPIVDLESGETVALEGLVRWRNPTGGILRPGEFLPVAEELGLIDAIGEWVLREIAAQSLRWAEEGIKVDIAYNLSPAQLRHPDLPERLLPILESMGVDPGSIIVEFPEAAAMTDPERTQKVLWLLRAGGMRLALEEFGAGGASLSRLQHLPVDLLKIDPQFVRALPDDDSASSMVMGMVQMARELDVTLVAEGIETDDQLRALIHAGCVLGQGYRFARPLSAEGVAERHRLRGLRFS